MIQVGNVIRSQTTPSRALSFLLCKIRKLRYVITRNIGMQTPPAMVGVKMAWTTDMLAEVTYGKMLFGLKIDKAGS